MGHDDDSVGRMSQYRGTGTTRVGDTALPAKTPALHYDCLRGIVSHCDAQIKKRGIPGANTFRKVRLVEVKSKNQGPMDVIGGEAGIADCEEHEGDFMERRGGWHTP
eukprot:CAMPEP_0172492452 /NCGR_PEP_ID=MMETSP1066-20121228/23618_1 /TAXON_ID=671091 /ORGANISM="Coscinodiscus wailesii, Strain CCMP2513" /LENGTH=106 /DNA_ID=CAMNT_0013262099 /DNA_START=508 /DNA_END=828 /DNA_ORIENTATION=-